MSVMAVRHRKFRNVRVALCQDDASSRLRLIAYQKTLKFLELNESLGTLPGESDLRNQLFNSPSCSWK